MKRIVVTLAIFALAPSFGHAQPACPPLLQHTYHQLQTGEPQSLCRYAGKVLLVVNTASKCGYTPQYAELEARYRKYKDRGLVVLGFPSDDFGGQEPGSNKQIAEFCRTVYGVQFPLYEKTTVTELARNPLYRELSRATGQVPKWNFHKYVVDRDGNPVGSFVSDVAPQSRELTALIERLLARKAAPRRVKKKARLRGPSGMPAGSPGTGKQIQPRPNIAWIAAR